MRSLARLTAVAFALVVAACGSKSPPAAEPEPAPAADAPNCEEGECGPSECDRDCADNCMADQYQSACIEDCGCNPDEVLGTGDPEAGVEE
ncbi:MAG: hypothetical protein K8M05_01780 [Deltaproteobacteria bacterium]|nr:hypothetical protein [Kofleriaceae bacterium]